MTEENLAETHAAKGPSGRIVMNKLPHILKTWASEGGSCHTDLRSLPSTAGRGGGGAVTVHMR